MNPVAFSVFGLEVRWYGLLIASAMVIGTIIASKRAKNYGIDEDVVIDILIYAIPAAIIGARLYYVIFEWERFGGDFYKIINLRTGGLAIHGGVIAAVLAGFIYCRIKKLQFPKLLDLFAPSIILGQAIGRWGNYMNGEAHGGPTDLPWGIMVDGVKVHPTFLYESLWNLAVFFLLLWIDKNHKKFNGQIFLTYGILYSIARFFIEGMRTDSLMIGGLRTAQLISISIIAVFAIVYIYKLNAVKKGKS